VRFISKLMLSVDGSLALGATQWLDGYRLGFTVRTFLITGTRVKLRLVLPGTRQTVDTTIIIEEAETEDWAEFRCVGVIHQMSPQHQSILESWLVKQRQGARS